MDRNGLILLLAALLEPMLTGCEQSTGAPGTASPTAPAPAAPNEVVAGGYRETTFDDIKFEQDPAEPFLREMITPRIEQIFDRKIRIRGYIYPTLKKHGLKQFVLVRDNLECCFGPGAALYDCILVTMVEGTSADYSTRPVTVEGIFRFDEIVGPDGTHLAVYQMNGEMVR